MPSNYEALQQELEGTGLSLPELNDSRRSWRQVQDRLHDLKRQLVSEEDDKEKRKLKAATIATEKDFLNLYHIKFAELYPCLLFENGEDSTYWIYDTDSGLYKKLNQSSTRSILMRALMNDGLTPTIAWVRECLAQFRAEFPDRGHDYSEFDSSSENDLHVENGWVNLKTLTLTAHTPDKLSTIKAHVVFDHEALCPTYDRLFTDWEMTEDQVKVMDEFSGYLLTNEVERGRMLVLEGEPGTGKSLVANIWTHILGDLAARECSLDLFKDNRRFVWSTFVGKRLVWFNETDPKRTQLGADLQKMIDGKTFSVERKGVNEQSEHVNMAKCVLTTNGLPDNMGAGMESRILYIKYTKVFRGTKDENAYLFDEVMKESSGILNRMIKGLQKLREQGKYTKIENQDDIMNEYRRTASLPVEFLEVHFEPCNDEDVDTFIYNRDFRTAFHAYAKGNVGYYTSPEKIAKEILRNPPSAFKQTLQQARRKDGRGFTGIKLKDNFMWGDGFDLTTITPIKRSIESPIQLPDNW